jgi:3-oxosteroid 1-dehydrogenase
MVSMRAERLLTADSAVIGVRASGQDFDGHVVLACGGFERDPKLVRTFLRGPMLAPASPPTNDGDGLRMGMSVGAALGNMSEAWWAPTVGLPGEQMEGAPFYRLMYAGDRRGRSSLIVDSRGRRFANELTNYNDFGRMLHECDYADYSFPRIPSWLIFDATRRGSAPLLTIGPTDPDPDWLYRADSLQKLADLIDVPGKALQESVARYNGHSTRGVDEDFGREAMLSPLVEPPFYAVRILPGCLGTKGGLRIDGNAQVQHSDDSRPVRGLFAAGNVVAHQFGAGDPAGGATIASALVFGWLAGEAAAS